MTQRSRRFLVTGGAGFIGSHLCDLLIREGHEVVVIDNLSTGSADNVRQLTHHERFQFVRADVMDEIALNHQASQAHVIIHLAAAVGVRLIVERPVHTIETNILGTEAVLKTGLRYGARVLLASTSEVYGKGIKLPFAEDDDVLLGSTNKSRWAYAASKMVDEFLGLAYHREYGLDVVPVRLFNTVGPRQTGQYGMVIPTFVRQAMAGKPLTVFGDGTQQRCFCHVRDVVQALYALAECEQASGTLFNVGGSEEVSILQLAERVNHLVGNRAGVQIVPYKDAYAPGFEDMARRKPDVERVFKQIGWRPEASLDTILHDVWEHEKSKERST